MVVEPDAGVDGRVAGTVQSERHGDVGLAGGPRDGDPPLLAGADGQFAERGGHAGGSVVAVEARAAISLAALMSRSFSSGSRTVSRRHPARTCPAGNVRGTSPRLSSASATAADRSGEPRVDQDEVRHGWPDGPAGQAQRRGKASAFGLDPREVGVEDAVVPERLGRDRHRDRRHGAGRPVRVESGHDASAGDGEPDAHAGERIGLAGRPHDHQVRVDRPQRQERCTDELGVRLVEDHDRRLADGIGRVGGEGRAGAPRYCRRARPGRWGCSGCKARRRGRRGPRSDRCLVQRPPPVGAASPKPVSW